MTAEPGEERRGDDLAADEQRDADPERRPERLRREPRGFVAPACARRTRDDGRRPVREEVEDRERAGEHRPGEAERGDLRPAEVADDRRVGEDVERLGRERAERGQREPDDLAVVRGAKTHRAADDNGPMQRPNDSCRIEPDRLVRLPSSRLVRVFLGLVFLAALGGLFWWRRGSLAAIGTHSARCGGSGSSSRSR